MAEMTGDARETRDDGIYDDRELDVALMTGGTVEGLGVDLDALVSRRERHVAQQMLELAVATSILLGEEWDADVPTDAHDALRVALFELKASVEDAQGGPLTGPEALALAMQSIIGGSFCRGIEVGLNLARARQATGREWLLAQRPALAMATAEEGPHLPTGERRCAWSRR